MLKQRNSTVLERVDSETARVFRDEVMRHQRLYPGKTVLEIAQHFGMDRKATDMQQIQTILGAREMRPYRKAGGVMGPVKAGPNRSQVKLA